MPDSSFAPSQELSYAVDYQLPSITSFNAELKGAGTLTINPAGPTYRFTGARRATFSHEQIELNFNADEIWNVGTQGRLVSFTTAVTPADRARKRAFVFFCASAQEAIAVAALMPRRLDADAVAEIDFAQRLAALSRAERAPVSVTHAIIALNALTFVAMGLLGAGWVQVESLRPYILYGANNGAATTDGEWWRLLTSMCMHYGIIHLALNMWALFDAGRFLERLQGRALYALTYLASGLGGGFASIFWHGDRMWSAGASGAVFGVFGAILGYAIREKQAIPATVFKALLKSSLIFAAYNIFFGLAARGIDNAAHLGGAATGFLFGALLALPLDPATRARGWTRRLQLGLVALAALVVTGVLATPRFAYRVSEEIAFDAIATRYGTRETELLEQHRTALQTLATADAATAHAAWIETTLVPFFDPWFHDLRALHLAPDRLTAQRRDLTLRYLEQFTAALRTLAAELRAQNPRALENYRTATQQAADEIARFNASRSPS